MRASQHTAAIVLRRTNYGEADRILSIITPSGNKLSVIAKGVRRPKSKLAGGLELLAVCDITFMKGRGDLGLITSSRLRTFYGNILQQYERMETAYSFIKRINTAAETVNEPEFYQILHTGLESLNNLSIDWRVTELWFLLQLRVLLGHGVNLTTDITGARLEPDKSYHYDFAEHAFYESPQGRFSTAQLKFLRLAAVKPPNILHHVGGTEGIIEDCLWLVRALES